MTMPSTEWSDSQKSALVQQIIVGGLSLQQACAQYGLTTDQLKEWVCIFRRSVRQALDNQLRSTLSVQGLDIEELSRAEFSGSLADMGVADLVQTIQMGRKDAHITVSHDGLESHIWCQGGEIIDAQSGMLQGADGLYRILAVAQGNVVADFSCAPRPRRIDMSTPRLLLEAASRNGQRERLLRRIGDPRRVFSVLADVAARQAADLGPEELDVLSLFDGTRSLDEVLAASELSDVEALEVAVRFYEAGVLASTHLQEPPPSSGHAALMAMTYRPFVGTIEPEPRRLPFWLLASGAVIFSSLGAATAVAYVGALPFEDVLAAFTSVRAGAAPLREPLPPSCPTSMVPIEAGSFIMGSDSSHPALDLARPAHPVNVEAFCIGVHEVKVEEYVSCVERGDCEPVHPTARVASDPLGKSTSAALHADQCNFGKPGRERHPMNCISYHQAARYCAASGTRLPREAEWEFAARGPGSLRFPWGEAEPTRDHMNACGKECERWHAEVGLSRELQGLMYEEDDGYSGSAPVGSFPLGSTRDGVMDLVGNVFEWTAGGYYAYDKQARTNPAGPSNADSYVIRGGNFNSGITEFSNPALRFAMHADSYSHGVGFRCAADLHTSATAPSSSHAPGNLEVPGPDALDR